MGDFSKAKLAISDAKLTTFDRVEILLYRCEVLVTGVSLAVMLVMIVISVTARFFDLPIPNTGEWALVAMSPLAFVGAAMCTYLGGHICIDVAQLLPSERLRAIARAMASIIQLTFAVLFVYAAWAFFDYAVDSGERLLDLGTPVAIPAAFLVIGGVLIIIHAAVDLVRQWLDLPHPRTLT